MFHFWKKAYIHRWLNREMISATILSGYKWNDVIDYMSTIFDANISEFTENDHGLFE